MYKEEIIHLNIKDRSIDLLQITNADEVIDALIASNPDNEDLLDERMPYWTDLWPAAIALSEFIEENNGLIDQKKIIEIGCGLGLPSIIAASTATEVTMTDYLEDALLFAQRNAALNNLENISFQKLDWRSIAPGHQKYDVILASDVAYEKRFFEVLPQALRAMMHYHSLAILSEPGRAFSIDFLEGLQEHFAVTKFSKEINWRGSKFNVGIFLLRAK
jgi:predicted nicotinamide N-methyase